jgi:hypothetical protein
MSTGSGFFGEAPGEGDQPSAEGADTAAGRREDGTFAEVFNGFTLGSGRGRRKRKKIKEFPDDPATEAPEQPLVSPPTDQGDHVTSVVSPPGDYYDPPGDYVVHEPMSGGLFDPSPSFDEYLVPTDYEPLDRDEETAIVRPYALTGGRTKANYVLELETLVSAKDSAAEGFVSQAEVAQVESLSIMEECRYPRSVAEIAAVLRVPLGVARVLISDAADAGLVTVHRTISGNDGAEAHLVLMERVLSGLRRL